jgi:hypothetical protein
LGEWREDGNKAPVPLGWTGGHTPPPKRWLGLVLALLVIVIGVALAALAVAFVVAGLAVALALSIVAVAIRLPWRCIRYFTTPRMDDGRRNVRVIDPEEQR